MPRSSRICITIGLIASISGLCIAFVAPVIVLSAATARVTPDEKQIMEHMLLIRRLEILQIVGLGISSAGAILSLATWIRWFNAKPE